MLIKHTRFLIYDYIILNHIPLNTTIALMFTKQNYKASYIIVYEESNL